MTEVEIPDARIQLLPAILDAARRAPVREGERVPLEIGSLVEHEVSDDRRRIPVHFGQSDPRGELVGERILDEHGRPFLGWVFRGAVDVSLREPHGGETPLEQWIKGELGEHCLRVKVTRPAERYPEIAAEFRVVDGSRD